MIRTLVAALLIAVVSMAHGQAEFVDLYPQNTITAVQPMTGLVFWHNSGNNNTDVISLEFSYMLFDQVVKDSGIYNWDAVDAKLEAIAGRKHQAIFRFRYVYPGYETSVPDYILNRADYHETVGNSEGKVTHFPDWTNEELKRFTMEFYTRFAERYGEDPRLAFVQVGFGLWAEYHIYDGPFILGETFPSKEFQEQFFHHLDTTFVHIPWSISVDAADATYTPFVAKPELKNIPFGVFDDSFMHQSHSNWNEPNWNFFGRDRYLTSPAGGEFSYYSNYDQAHVLDWPNGPYGTPYEKWARDFHITYMLANDQPQYQTMERIKEASMASGYQFKIASLKAAVDTSVFQITNYGVAPIYYDAFITVNGTRSPQTLRLLAPGDTITCSVPADARDAAITIECDKLVPGQEIQFYGTQELPVVSVQDPMAENGQLLYPNPVSRGGVVYLERNPEGEVLEYLVYDSLGKLALRGFTNPEQGSFSTGQLNGGVYFLRIIQDQVLSTTRFLVL